MSTATIAVFTAVSFAVLASLIFSINILRDAKLRRKEASNEH